MCNRCFYIIVILLAFVNGSQAQPFDGFIRFDGLDDYLSIESESIFPERSDFTIEFWFRVCNEVNQSSQAIIGNSDNLEINFFIIDNYTSYYLCAMNSQKDNYICHSDFNHIESDLEWHHFAVTYKYAQDKLGFFYDGIDGTLGNQHEYDFSVSGPFYVGKTGYRTWLTDHFRGFLDEMRISDTIRYENQFDPPTQKHAIDKNTIGLWRFDEKISNKTIQDSSGNNFDFSVSGNPKILRFDSIVEKRNDTLFVIDFFERYQWVDCSNNNQPIEGATSSSFSPIVSGTYAVETTLKGCSLTSTCYNVEGSGTGLKTIPQDLQIEISPNPTSNLVVIKLKGKKQTKIELFDEFGQLLFTENTRNELSSIDLSSFSAGLYYLRILCDEQIAQKKLVKL